MTTWTAMTFDHKAHLMEESIISRENSLTFISELKFLKLHYPKIRNFKLVTIVDGDRAKWAAIRQKLP